MTLSSIVLLLSVTMVTVAANDDDGMNYFLPQQGGDSNSQEGHQFDTYINYYNRYHLPNINNHNLQLHQRQHQMLSQHQQHRLNPYSQIGTHHQHHQTGTHHQQHHSPLGYLLHVQNPMSLLATGDSSDSKESKENLKGMKMFENLLDNANKHLSFSERDSSEETNGHIVNGIPLMNVALTGLHHRSSEGSKHSLPTNVVLKHSQDSSEENKANRGGEVDDDSNEKGGSNSHEDGGSESREDRNTSKGPHPSPPTVPSGFKSSTQFPFSFPNSPRSTTTGSATQSKTPPTIFPTHSHPTDISRNTPTVHTGTTKSFTNSPNPVTPSSSNAPATSSTRRTPTSTISSTSAQPKVTTPINRSTTKNSPSPAVTTSTAKTSTPTTKTTKSTLTTTTSTRSSSTTTHTTKTTARTTSTRSTASTRRTSPNVPTTTTSKVWEKSTNPTTTTVSITPSTTTRPTTTLTTTSTTTLTTTTSTTTTARPTTTPVSTSPKPEIPEICQNSQVVKGVGYKAHWSDCAKFIECHFTTDGTVHVIMRSCQHGTYWDQKTLSCVQGSALHCPYDLCQKEGFDRYPSLTNCRGYWICQNGKSEAYCCPPQYSYDVMTSSCVPNVACNDKCGNVNVVDVCDKRAVNGRPLIYQQNVPGQGWVEQVCPQGTSFISHDCKCSWSAEINKTEILCQPELYIPFNGDIRDESGNNNYLQVDGVKVVDGAGYFDGKSLIRVPRFSNVDYGDTFIIKLRYKEEGGGGAGAGQSQALVANGDCNKPSSLYMVTGQGRVDVGLRTNKGQNVSVVVPKSGPGWKDAIMMADKNVLHGTVNGITYQTLFTGSIETSKCALQIGRGTDFKHFSGYMDDITVYLCKPKGF